MSLREKPNRNFTNRLTSQMAFGYSLARVAAFAAQQFSLPVFEYIATGKTKTSNFNSEKLKSAYEELFTLLKKDNESLKRGDFPLEALRPESPAEHFWRIPEILIDGYSIAKRRDSKKNKDFGAEEQQYLDELPEYFKRNFHFQSGGYLTDKSARLYEHQVEILFSGAADPMRRQIISQMKRYFEKSVGKKIAAGGEGLHFLEVAAGTGRLTRFVRMAFPNARITVTDISDPYLKQARRKLEEFDRLDFVRTPAEKLPFADETFDAVYSCFLFHELPSQIRKDSLAEARRVLKPKGIFGFVDSLQLHDGEKFQWALNEFPTDFHEPFFKDYSLKPMENLAKDCGLSLKSKELGFLSKSCIFSKEN